MKRAILALLVISGFVTSGFLYERLFRSETFGPPAMVAVAFLTMVFLSLLLTYLLYDTPYREWTLKLWLAGVSTISSFVLLDLIAGFLLIQPLSPALAPDQHRHHKLVPNSHSLIEQRDFSYVQRVNNIGLRGRDVALEKPSATYRILMLGDSFTMGKGVQDDETFSVLLERQLNGDLQRCAEGQVEVLNGGVDSYAPILSFLQLERDLHTLAPDLIVLNLDVSDLVQEAAYRRQATYGTNGKIVAVPGGGPRVASLNERIRSWTERRLFFTRAVLFYANRLLEYRDLNLREVLTHADAEVTAHTLASDPVSRDEQWRDMFDSLIRIKRFADQRGIGFALVAYPWAHQISDSEWIPGRYTFIPKNAKPSDKSLDTIKRMASESGIEVVDVFPWFRAALGRAPLYFRYDAHWTPTGHQVMAEALHEYLRSTHGRSWCGQAPAQ